MPPAGDSKERVTQIMTVNNMNTFHSLATAAALLASFALSITTLAQGSLTPPPGPITPVMKSLDQIEARTPLIPGAPGVTHANGLYTLTEPGSYYLTGNLVRTNTAGGALIRFAANNITLDLNGFTLFGTNGNMGVAIVGGGFGYRVHNGHIVGGTTQTNGVFTPAGFHSGIELFSGSVNRGTDSLVSGVTVRGVRYRGIQASLNSIVKDCVVDTTVDAGIWAGSVSDCRAINAGEDAILAATVLNCVGKSVGAGDGISYYQDEPSVVQNSVGEAVSGTGIYAHQVMNSRGKSVSGVGIYANSNAAHCSGESASGSYGVFVTGTASFCRGSRPGGIALQAAIAIGCSGGTINSTQKHLGTP